MGVQALTEHPPVSGEPLIALEQGERNGRFSRHSVHGISHLSELAPF
jgi:hypothetical protein